MSEEWISHGNGVTGKKLLLLGLVVENSKRVLTNADESYIPRNTLIGEFNLDQLHDLSAGMTRQI